MAAIYLIRHGQASFGQTDYDHLSPKGAKQSELLGKNWNKALSPTQCFTGGMLRHKQTHEHFFNGFNQPQVQATELFNLNEFDHDEILVQFDPAWQDIEYMHKRYAQKPDPKKSFNQDFVKALNRWMSNDFDDDYNESWQQFKTRCIQGFNDVIRHANENRTSETNKELHVAVFTSGGTISVILQHILQLQDEQSLKLNQQIRNTSVSKVLFSGNNISVDYINNYTHLEKSGPDWSTFR